MKYLLDYKAADALVLARVLSAAVYIVRTDGAVSDAGVAPGDGVTPFQNGGNRYRWLFHSTDYAGVSSGY